MGQQPSQLSTQTTLFLPPVHIISLPADEKRRKLFVQRNQAVLCRSMWSFVHGVNGAALQPDERNSCVVRQQDLRYFSDGALGCALSHLEQWEACRKSGVPLCVLEDDAVLHTDFVRGYHRLMRSLEGRPWDIVLLSYNLDAEMVLQGGAPFLICRAHQPAVTAKEFLAKPLPEFLGIGRVLCAFGTCAYVVSPRGANKLVDLVFPLQRKLIPNTSSGKLSVSTVDGMMSTVYPLLEAYVSLTPLVITEKGTPEYTTTIT